MRLRLPLAVTATFVAFVALVSLGALAPSEASAEVPAAKAPAAPTAALAPVELTLVEPTAVTGKPPTVAVLAPAKNQVVTAAKAASFELKLSPKNWKVTPGGDHLCVVLDKGACQVVDDLKKPLRLGDLGGKLDEGQHVVSVIARRANGEFVRPSGKSQPFASVSFFVGKKTPPVHKDGSPMLFWSPPVAAPAPAEGVLLDYFVANGSLAPGKLGLHVSVGGPGIESGVGLAVKQNKPLRLRGARAGEYLARFSLVTYAADLGGSVMITVTYSAQPMTGPFAEVERFFRVLP
jgi:hypothetical protein